jgi:hypothetical protein
MARGQNRRAVSAPKEHDASGAAVDAAFYTLFGCSCAAAGQSTVLRQVSEEIRDQMLADVAHMLEHQAWPCGMQVLHAEYVSSETAEGFGLVSTLDTTALRGMPRGVLSALHATLACSRADLVDYNQTLSSVLRTGCWTK